MEHGALDDGRLEVAGCCWRDTVLGDDAAESSLGLEGLCDAASAVLGERERGVEPDAQPAGGLTIDRVASVILEPGNIPFWIAERANEVRVSLLQQEGFTGPESFR